jgi:hypothetical protein
VSIPVGRLVLNVFMLLVFVVALVMALDFPDRASYFPLAVSGAGALVVVTTTMSDILTLGRHGRLPVDRTQARRSARYLLWIAGYLVLIFIAGLMGATAIFLAAFLRLEAGLRWWVIGVCIAAMLTGLYIISFALNLAWPVSFFV